MSELIFIKVTGIGSCLKLSAGVSVFPASTKPQFVDYNKRFCKHCSCTQASNSSPLFSNEVF